MNCKACGAADTRYAISARNFDPDQRPGTYWGACRDCCAEDHRRGGVDSALTEQRNQ